MREIRGQGRRQEKLERLGGDWEEREARWFGQPHPFPFGCGYYKDLEFRVKGAGTRYKWWKKHHSARWRQQVFEVARALPRHEAYLFGSHYNSSKFTEDPLGLIDIESKYGYQSWKEASEALRNRVNQIPRKRSDQLLTHFLDGIYAVDSDHQDKAWELAAMIAEATFAEVDPPKKFGCLSLGGSRR